MAIKRAHGRRRSRQTLRRPELDLGYLRSVASRRDVRLHYAFAAIMLALAALLFTAAFGGPDVLGEWSSVVFGSLFIGWFSLELPRPSSAGRGRALRTGQVAGIVLLVIGLLSVAFA